MTPAEVAAARHAPLDAILAGARSGLLAAALAASSEYHGVYDGEHRTTATRRGVDVDGHRVTWRQVAAVIEPNLTPGLLAEGVAAHRLYVDVATDGINAINDPVAYWWVHTPAYRAAAARMSDVRSALTAPAQATQLGLFG